MSTHRSPGGRGRPPSHDGRPTPAGAPIDTDYVTDRLVECMNELRRVRYRKASHLMARIESFDAVTFAHCVRVSELAFRLGDALDLPRREVRLIERAALFHDAGKLCVPRAVLDKAGRLEGHEWRVIREHPGAGELICLEATGDPQIATLVRRHHERLDGTGYPDRLGAARIPLAARILQLADIFDALTTERPYKPVYTSEQALDIIDEEVGAGWRDRHVAAALREIVD